ncbi:Cadherin-related family member 5 [Bagarius yarrelli]|uniref:Cadherin-related family member 5 n=1 Tax=Bagarius yarrelli TaxID=175774 RepID=A0A556TI04_BAGYA|nr:Cadherin-related family member 5 [Bagarius yarrelli]
MPYILSLVQVFLLSVLVFQYTATFPSGDRYRRSELQTRQLGDLEFTSRHAELLKSKAKLSSLCSFLRRMQNSKKSGLAGDTEHVNTLMKQYMSNINAWKREPARAETSGAMDLNYFIPQNIVFFLLALLTVNTSAQICVAPGPANIDENNNIGDTVATITIQEGVSLLITENPLNAFGINGNRVVANVVLDYESLPIGGGLIIGITCTMEGLDPLSKVDTRVGKIDATDLDGDRLYYHLVSPKDEFGLQADSNPEILVKKILDYDTIKEVTLKLFAQDTPLTSTGNPSHTATTTIIVTILDINNRPPWFQPCTESIVGTTKICLSAGYTGTVNLNEQVCAYELENPDQFATTTVRLQVVISSKHPPQFVKPKYEGFISEDAGVGSLVMESKSRNIPLQVQATDADFSDGVNPDIKFEVLVDSDFKITPEGFIIMTRAASPGNVSLQISVVDTTNGESSRASLSVEVTPGVSTTDMPTTTNRPNSTVMTTTMATSTSITTDTTNKDTATVTVTHQTEVTSSPYTIATNHYTTYSSYTEGLPLLSGDFRTEDMIALGVSLAVALLLCFVIIGFLAYTLRRSNAAWRKLSEASIFRSSLSGSSKGPKDGVQYTNEGFQADEDTDSVTSKQAAELTLPQGKELSRNVQEVQETQETQLSAPSKSSDDSFTYPTDSSSQNSSDNTDNEKEVKPILTKERRMEDGYKAVWFKEDIDLNNKDTVVIDRDEDIDHEDDYNNDDYDEDERDDSNFAQF